MHCYTRFHPGFEKQTFTSASTAHSLLGNVLQKLFKLLTLFLFLFSRDHLLTMQSSLFLIYPPNTSCKFADCMDVQDAE